MKQIAINRSKKIKSLSQNHDKPEKNYHKKSEESILKIIRDDILRITGEKKNEKFSLKSIKSKIKVSNYFILKAIEELEKDGMIQFEKNFIGLNKKGQEKAESIIKKHLVLENYLKRKRSEKEAHKAADILEHCISEEVLNNIKKLSTLKGKDLPLTEFEINRENLITDIEFSVGGLFERAVSMGILPGEKISIIYKIPDGFVVNVSRKKIALGKDIAKKIRCWNEA